MEKKLIFVDIDGTLTVPGKLIPPESAQRAVREARERGHKVFICTGRNWSMMTPLMAYGFDGTIASAGGYVECGGQVLFDDPMPHALRDKVARVLDEAGYFYVMEARNGVYGSKDALRMMGASDSESSEARRWKEAAEANNRLVFESIDEYDDAPVYKFLFVGRGRAGLEKIERELEDEFFVCRQNFFSEKANIHGELIRRTFDKGTGVKQICAHLNVPLEDTIGFGDSMNDLAMLETVGIGVCMDNGDENLKKVSRMVCPAVEDDGLYRAFVQLGLIEG